MSTALGVLMVAGFCVWGLAIAASGASLVGSRGFRDSAISLAVRLYVVGAALAVTGLVGAVLKLAIAG